MSDEDGLTCRKRTKKVRWDEHGRTLTWDGEEAREEAEAQTAREESREEAEGQEAREEAREEAEAQAAREARRKVSETKQREAKQREAKQREAKQREAKQREAKQRFAGTGANPEFNAHVGSSFGPGTYSIDCTTFTIELNKLPAGRLAAKLAQAATQLQQERQRLLGLLDQNTASLKGLDLV
jgi:hypothetical protein